MTEQAVEIIIQVKCGDVSKEITEELATVDLLSQMQKISRGLEQMMTTTALEVVEASLHSQVPKSWKNLGTAKRVLLSESGSISFRRHIYEDQDKQRRKPLDEFLNIEPYERNSKKVEAMIASLASESSYRQTANLSSYILNDQISASTVGRMCRRVGEKVIAMESYEQFQEPVMGTCPADVLYCESDGLYIHLQREKEAKAEVKIAMFYTGKERIGRQKRFRCTDKITSCQLGLSGLDWQSHLREIAWRHYDLDHVCLAVAGGDGAEWVRNSFDCLGLPLLHKLDKYHVVKSLKEGFGSLLDISELKKKLFKEGFPATEKTLLEAIVPDDGAFRERQIDNFNYLKNNQDILTNLDTRGLEDFKFSSLGAMEGNVDKLLRQRMKGRGMSWTIRGAKSLLAIIRHKALIRSQAFAQIGHVEIRSKTKAARVKKSAPEWIATTYTIPAFQGNSAPFSWVQLLKSRLNDSLSINTFF